MSSCAVIDCIGIESIIHENFDTTDKHIFISREVNQRLLKETLKNILTRRMRMLLESKFSCIVGAAQFMSIEIFASREIFQSLL